MSSIRSAVADALFDNVAADNALKNLDRSTP